MQNSYFNFTKQNLKLGEILVVLDFAENYSFIHQDEIQSYYWAKSQATIHPFGIYYNTDQEVQFTNFIVISDIMKHNTTAVQLFLKKLIMFVTTNICTPKKYAIFRMDLLRNIRIEPTCTISQCLKDSLR